MPQRFEDVHVSHSGRYSLGRDTQDKVMFLSIPVANRMVDYEEYYRLDATEFDAMLADEHAAAAFAEACRRRAHDDRLILAPGTDRGTPR